MNHIYKSVWNKFKRLFVVVNEAKVSCKKSKSQKVRAALASLVLALSVPFNTGLAAEHVFEAGQQYEVTGNQYGSTTIVQEDSIENNGETRIVGGVTYGIDALIDLLNNSGAKLVITGGGRPASKIFMAHSLT